tara:strand:+ start:268 stop:513 length:246 start_codon:yes stop_codon:yes gene_type:complete
MFLLFMSYQSILDEFDLDNGELIDTSLFNFSYFALNKNNCLSSSSYTFIYHNKTKGEYDKYIYSTQFKKLNKMNKRNSFSI